MAAAAAGEAVKKPKLAVEERLHETGEVARDKVVEHSFKIRNIGDATLEILNVVQPPNFEVVSKPAALAPGEAGEIRVRVPLIHDKAAALSKQFELKTNDPDTPSFGLELRILSTEYVVVKPGFARWIYVQHELPGSIAQKLASRDGGDFEVLGLSTPPPGITASTKAVQKEVGGPREWQIDLALSADAPIGPIVGTLLVQVKHPKQAVVPIPLSGFVRPAIVVTPNELRLGELSITAKTAQAFIVKTYSTAPMQVLRVEHDLQGFPPAVLETVKPGREYKVKLDFDPATMPKGAIPAHSRSTPTTPKYRSSPCRSTARFSSDSAGDVDASVEVGAAREHDAGGRDVALDRRAAPQLHLIRPADRAAHLADHGHGACGERSLDAPGGADGEGALNLDLAREAPFANQIGGARQATGELGPGGDHRGSGHAEAFLEGQESSGVVERATGFEPATSSLGSLHSTN